MRKKSLCFAILAALLLLCACGKRNEAVGRYVGTVIEQKGCESPFSDRFSEGENSIQLRKDGTGVFTLNGDMCALDWKLSGSRLTVTTQGEKSVGSLTDGVIRLDFLDGATVMTFVREDLLPQEDEPKKPEPQIIPESDLGNETYTEWEGRIGGVRVTILSMEYTTGLNGEACVRVFFELRNENTEPVDAGLFARFCAYQDGKALKETFGGVKEKTDLAAAENLKFGTALTVSRVFVLRDRSAVAVEVTDAERKTVVAGVFEP